MEGGKNVAGYLTALLDLLVDRQDAFVPGDFQAEERELYGALSLDPLRRQPSGKATAPNPKDSRAAEPQSPRAPA